MFAVYGAAGLVMACAIGTLGQFGFATRVWLASLSTLALDRGPRSEIRAEPTLGRMVIRGEFGLGTTRRVRDALLAAPWARLVELDSPSGVAVEGLALSKLLEGGLIRWPCATAAAHASLRLRPATGAIWGRRVGSDSTQRVPAFATPAEAWMTSTRAFWNAEALQGG